MSNDEAYLEAERAKWDAAAHEEIERLEATPPDQTWERYCAESSTMVGIGPFLGSLSGKRVLEYGCGMGRLTVLLARAGAHVTSFDISPGSVEVARRRLAVNGLEGDVQVADAHQLPFDDESFDVVVGRAILHHLDPPTGAAELRRVVRVGGRVAFTEPMGMNPVLNFVRDHVPYPHKNPPGGDKPVDYEDIAIWEAGYSEATHREVQLTSMLERGLGFGRSLPALRRLDDRLLAKVPALRKYCRYVVLTMTR